MSLRGRASLGGDDDDDFYAGTTGAAEQQRLLERDQDDSINQLSRTVERVQGMALRVNEELASQNKLIADIDEDVERTDSRLKGLQGRLRHLANDSDRGKYCLICILLGVLGVLVLMVLS